MSVHGSVARFGFRSFLGATLLMVGACTTVGPDYQEPDVAWLEDWQTDLYGQVLPPAQRAEEDLRFWWQLFDDPVLNNLIAVARRENLSLQLAGLRVLEARAAAGLVNSARYPQVQQVTGSATSVTSGESGSGDTDSFGNYDLGFGIGWEVDFWGKYRRSIESADAAFFASIANQQDFQVLLTAQVTDLYYAYLATKLRIDIARSNADIQMRAGRRTNPSY